ncbi:Protein mlp1 [Marasmius tenuissimus]|uniref:Protein mlp1 n=1 Tax=Marasmius tenuissimus TaxID=585030 RepID=A0ABR2ZAU3_9AGAR
MVQTRGKGKAKETGGEGTPELEYPSFTVPLPEDLDLDSLSNVLPDDFDIHSPTPEAVAVLYELLVSQSSNLDATQRDLDEARAESEKKEVELDQALQDRETQSKDLETQLESVQEELKQVKKERDQLVSTQNELQTKVAALSSSQTSSTSEVQELKNRLDDAEREKRELLGIISRLKQEESQRDEEIQNLRTNLRDARQEHQTLEGQVREIRATETSSKFKLDTLSQQLELAKSEADRANTELVSKSEELAQYRRTKQAEIVTLQANLDAATQSNNSTQATLKALQSSHANQTHQLTQALTKVQDLTGQLAEQEATYSSEANALKRLVSMLEEREKQAREIVESIEQDWSGYGAKAESREAELQAELEREIKAREIAEVKVEKLEKVLEKMGRGELPLPGRESMSGTTEQGAMMGLSPTVAMASRVQKTGKGFTEVYAEYVKLQDDYTKKCAEYEHMDRTLGEVLAQIEERAPILAQQRVEYERLQAEASQLATQLSQALSERDAQSHLAQENAQKVIKSAKENQLLHQQLEDLGRQLRTLLKEIARRDDPNMPPDEELEAMVPPAEDVESVITNHLVLYRSIDNLQEQNQKLLKIVRELGQKMENEEQDYRETIDKEQAEAVKEAHEVMEHMAAQHELELKSKDATIKAYLRENDMLKIENRRLKAGNPEPVTASDIAGDSELAQELAETQSRFNAYRTEMGVDVGRYREDAASAQREAAALQAALAKANAKIDYLSDRHRMSQDEFTLHRQEFDELNKRNAHLFDQWTRADIERGRLTEDLRTASSRVEQLRNECSNLRAEKKIWEAVHSRLTEENKTLAMERSHLSDLMSNVQKMHNDLERSGDNDRRRLESQLQLVEGQTQDLRTQLLQERDSVRQITLQKDIELKELQTRLDKTTHDLSSTRESLVVAETTKTHQEERIRDLTKQLQGNEEKLSVYERRTGIVNTTTTVDQNLSKEQQLEAEVAELRSKLKVAELDLATARGHVQQFKEISQANESALESLNNTFDEFKASTEAQIARHESEYKALEQRLKEAQQELSEITNKHGELQKQLETERIAWANDKKTLEDTIVDLGTSEKMTENDRLSRENEIKAQEERRKTAEEKYSNEVVAHAESIKTIEQLRKQLGAVQATVREHQTAAETASAKLASSEGSWSSQREALDKEISELKSRNREINEQNQILHQHLDSVSSQAARIRQAADSEVAADGEGQAVDSDAKLSELRSVVAYLRKQKEIVDLQLELSKQENIRVKAQVDHLQQTLNETRQTLSEERERAVEAAASAVQHNELVERINQLNILRESNATLRADCEAQTKRAKELEAKLNVVSRKISPLEEANRVTKAELEARDAQVKRLEEENRRWQERNHQLLSKYDRTDPAELQALKDEIEQLKTLKTELESDLKQRQAEVDSHKKRMEALEQNLTTFKEKYQQNSNTFRSQMITLNNQKATLSAQNKDLENKVTALQKDIENLQTSQQAQQGSAKNEADQTVLTSLREERDRLLAEKATWAAANAPTGTTDEASQQAWENEKAELTKSRDNAQAALKEANEKTEKAIGVIRSNKTIYERHKGNWTAEKEKILKDQEEAIKAAVEKAKTEVQSLPQAEGSSPDVEALVKKHNEELTALEKRLTDKFKQDLEAAVAVARKEGSSSESTSDVQAAIDAAIAEHNKTREKDIEAAMERGRMEMNSKLKVKEGQFNRSQLRLRAFEAQVETWKKDGTIPPDTVIQIPAANATPAKPTGAAAAPPTSPATSSAPTTKPANGQVPQAKPAPRTAPTGSAALPRKPGNTSGAAATTPAAPVASTSGTAQPATAESIAPGAGRGRGVALGRGAAPGVAARTIGARGGAPIKRGAAPATAPPSGGVSIHGAAKRPAPDSPADDSLAKRLKPAPAAAGTTPVTLKRPPPQSGPAP